MTVVISGIHVLEPTKSALRVWYLFATEQIERPVVTSLGIIEHCCVATGTMMVLSGVQVGTSFLAMETEGREHTARVATASAKQDFMAAFPYWISQ
jgi:hypothetical protein